MRQERRRSPRLHAYLPVKISKSGTRVVETLTKDVSESGVRFLTPEPPAVGTRVKIELTLPSPHQVVTVQGRAAWFRVLPDSDQFDIGVQFEDLTQETRILLSRYLELHQQPAGSR